MMKTYLILIISFCGLNLLNAQIESLNKKCLSKFDSISNKNVYVEVDDMPTFPGGLDEMIKYIEKNLKWPNTEADFTGTVIISAIVESNGKLSNPRITRGIYYMADNEALRIINMMPNWNIGKCNNKPVPVLIKIPIKFTII